MEKSKLSRRRFVGNSALGMRSLAAGSASRLIASESPSSGDTIRDASSSEVKELS